MRQNIKLVYAESVIDEPSNRNVEEKDVIYIYSHWDGNKVYKDSGLAQSLKTALSRKQRWDDESYLAKIIMSEVIRNSLDEETGYGLAPYEVDPEFPTIVVNLEKQTVDGKPYQEFIDSF